MPKVEVVAKSGFVYDGIPRPEGQRFDCDVNDLKLLRTIGKVALPEGADEPVEPEAHPAEAPVRRRYRRRDMTAEA